MFSKRRWVVACQDCEVKMHLGEDLMQNLVDVKGSVIPSCYQALEEFLGFCDRLQLHFPRVEAIKRFVDAHPGHRLRLAPVVDEEFDEYGVTDEAADLRTFHLRVRCVRCHQTCLFEGHLVQEAPIADRLLTIRDQEWFTQLLETYNHLGLRITDHRQVRSLELLLPFLRRHAGHEIRYQTHPQSF